MSIESDLLEDIDFHDIVRSFAENKSCKKYFSGKLTHSNMSNVGSRCRLFLDIWSEYYEL